MHKYARDTSISIHRSLIHHKPQNIQGVFWTVIYKQKKFIRKDKLNSGSNTIKLYKLSRNYCLQTYPKQNLSGDSFDTKNHQQTQRKQHHPQKALYKS